MDSDPKDGYNEQLSAYASSAVSSASATQLSNHTTLILAMTNMDIRVPFDEAYVTLVGTAVYLFSYYEWTIIYVIERLEPGFLPEYCRNHRRGITSGKVSERFKTAVDNYHGGKGVETTELECCSQIFYDLVQKRNALIHAHPITDEGGAQILNYQASPSKQISDMKWESVRLEEFIREIDVAAYQIGNVFEYLR